MALMRDAMDKFLSFLGELLNSPQYLIDKVENLIKYLGILKSDDVTAQGQFQKQVQKLNELLVEVRLYKDAIRNRPLCTKGRMDAIFKELNCDCEDDQSACEADKFACKDDQFAYFDKNDKKRFPRTISFIHELDSWLKRVKEQYKKVYDMHERFEKETLVMAKTAQDAAKKLREKTEETMRPWKGVGLVLGAVGIAVTCGAAVPAVVAAAMGGGTAISVFGAGVGISALSGVVTGAGVIASSEDRRDESTQTELKKEYVKMNKEANELRQFTTSCKVVSESSILKNEEEVILRDEMPLLIDLKPLFEKIFKLMNLDIDFDDLNKLNKELDNIADHGRK